MALDKEEKKVLEEIERWQRGKFRTGIISKVVNDVFYPLERLVDFVLSDKIIEKATVLMKEILKNLQKSSQGFVNTGSIIKKASDAGLSVKDVADFRNIPMAYLDILAKSLFEKNAKYMALQGIGLGAGGYAFVLVDLPMLFMVNLKTIFQIGACYGYKPESIREKEFALQVFCITSSAGGEQQKELRRMDKLIMSFIEDTFSDESSIFATEKAATGFTNRLLRWFIKKKATRGFPLVGAVMGSGFNYLYTKESAIYAYMFYRKRFLKNQRSQRRG